MKERMNEWINEWMYKEMTEWYRINTCMFCVNWQTPEKGTINSRGLLIARTIDSPLQYNKLWVWFIIFIEMVTWIVL